MSAEALTATKRPRMTEQVRGIAVNASAGNERDEENCSYRAVNLCMYPGHCATALVTHGFDQRIVDSGQRTTASLPEHELR